MENFENKTKGLEKLINSDLIKKVYPMVDHITVDIYKNPFNVFAKNDTVLNFEIYLNNPDIIEKNIYESGLDPHYLVDYHIKNLLPYIGLDEITALNFVVYGTDGEIISKWNDN
jgi:hypothetical protein